MSTSKNDHDIIPFIDFRKDLHRHPELSGREEETKKRVLHFLRQFNPDRVYEVGKTGLVFEYAGERKAPSLMVRAELDALPIQETNDFPHRSAVDGVSHKCGHDGHMAILARLASLLETNRSDYSRVFLLFQPAEENGHGAKEIYADSLFRSLPIDAVVALHNLPGFAQNTIIVKSGPMTPAVRSMIVRFHGKTSHAAEPEKGFNPALAIADFIKAALSYSEADPTSDTFLLVTPIYLHMGELSYGVSAGHGEVHLTIRAKTTEYLMEQSEKLSERAREIAGLNQLTTDISWTEEFDANMNHKEMVDTVIRAAVKLRHQIVEPQHPMKWGEDFGLFTNHFPGAMFCLGAGEDRPALHNPDYDFPDELIETGSALFWEIVKEHSS